MKNFLRAMVLFLLGFSSLQAQTFIQAVQQQVTDPKLAYDLSFKQPNTAPCTLIMSVRGFSVPVFTDTNQNVWAKAPGRNPLWYTTSCGSGPNTVHIPFAQPSYFQAVIAEYAGVLTPRQVSDLQTGAGTISATSPFVDSLAGDLILGFGWNETSNFDTVTAGAGFTLRGDANAYLEDMIQPADGPAVSTVSYAVADAIGWHEAVASFMVSVPPPPPPDKIVLAVSGSVLFDDQSTLPIAPNVNIQQSDNKGNLVSAGQIGMDSTGSLSGNLVVDPALVGPSGFINLQFSIDGIGATISQSFLLQEFQQGSTGLNLQLILFKSAMLPKSFGAGLVP